MQGMKYLDEETNKEYILMVMTVEEAEKIKTAINTQECEYIDKEDAETEDSNKKYWRERRQHYSDIWMSIYRAIHNGECDEPEEI